MTPNLFDLDFTRLEIISLSLIPALINFLIFLYTTFFVPQNKTTYSFSIFLLLLGLWQMGDCFVKLSKNPETALQWYMISGIFISFIISFGIIFILCFTKWNKKIAANLTFSLVFLPAIICSFFVVAQLDEYTLLKSEQWYWIVNPDQNVFTIIIYLWTALGGLLMLIMLWLYYIKAKGNDKKRKQSLLLAVGFSVPVIGGIAMEVIAPLLLEKNVIPITNSLLSFFSVTSLVAIQKYGMLEYSPKHQWDKIMEAMNESVVIADNDDEIMYTNKKFYELTGYDEEFIVGQDVKKLLFGNENLEKIKNINEERKRKKSSQYEIQIRKKTGEKIWILVSGSPYLDRKGNVVGSIAILTDINTLKQTENILWENELNLIQTVNRLERITQGLRETQAIAQVGDWELDLVNNKMIWGDEALRIYGLLPGENEQTFESWITFIHPDDLELVKEEIKKSQETLSDSFFYHRIICKDGTVKYIHTISKFNEEGKYIGIYGICHDVTELKESEEKLNALNHELKTFIYKSSHDLRGPLATVLGVINLAKKELTDTKSLHYISIIGELSKKLDTILLRLVEAMSLKERKMIIQPVDVKDLMNEILNSHRHTDGFEKIKVSMNIQITTPIHTNHESMHSILLNLIENAIKYRNLNLAQNEINICMFRDENGNTILEVADNGIGIMEKAQNKIFDMFYRATDAASGSGLGLYLVKTGVEKLGGKITVESKENMGTKFIIILPDEIKN